MTAATAPRPPGSHVGLALVALAVALAAAACLPSSLRPTPSPPPAASPTPSPSPTASPTPGPPTPTPGPTFELYTVRRGDTLTSIARRFLTTGRSIAYWNRDAYPSLDPESPSYNPNRLDAGWVLRVLPGQEHEAPLDEGEAPDETPVPPLYPDDEPGEGESPEAGG